MANLSNPSLEINISTVTPETAIVRATVDVDLTKFEEFVAGSDLVDLELKAQLFGEDFGAFRGGDDELFLFPNQNIISDGTYTFEGTVSFGTLNEDNLGGKDEIYSSFNLFSTESAFPVNVSTNSPTVEGQFG